MDDEDLQYTLSLNVEDDDIFFSDSSTSEKELELADNGRRHEENAKDFSAEEARNLESQHILCCLDDLEPTLDTESNNPCFNTTSMEEQERDRTRWGFPQLRKVVYEGEVDLKAEGIICMQEGSVILSSGKILGAPNATGKFAKQKKAKINKELGRELYKFRQLAIRLHQEGAKIDHWVGNVERIMKHTLEKQWEKGQAEAERSRQKRDLLVAQIRALKKANTEVFYSRQELENM